jgi:hypothetical protein
MKVSFTPTFRLGWSTHFRETISMVIIYLTTQDQLVATLPRRGNGPKPRVAASATLGRAAQMLSTATRLRL